MNSTQVVLQGSDEFHQVTLLGTGNFAYVERATHKSLQQTVVLKTLSKRCNASTPPKVQKQYAGFLEREKWCLENLNHENVVHAAPENVRHKLGLGKSCTFQDSRSCATVLVMEHLDLGDLFYFVEKKHFIEEPCALSIFRDLLRGAMHLHSNGVAHLDIKCENIFLRENSQGKLTAKLGDFGLVQVQALGDDIERVTEHNGTECIMCPESLIHYVAFDGRRADAWALGYVLFVMLTGFPPMTIANRTCPWFTALRQGPGYFWDRVDKVLTNHKRPVPSAIAKKLVVHLLNPKPVDRWTPKEALLFMEENHPYFKKPENIDSEVEGLSFFNIDSGIERLGFS
jgi:serine/threonine protein kinase